jgi:hypothetical protein
LAAIAGRSGKKPAITIGGVSRETGKAGAASSSGAGMCAERNLAARLGGDPKKIDFTKPVRARKGTTHPVCKECQKVFDKSQFPKGTEFE